jgi:hypothetical protein
MTTAMAAYCAGGIVLCADSNIAYGDQKWQALKVVHSIGEIGSFAIAGTSYDVNAANTMIGSVMESVRTTQVTDRQKLESLVVSKMSKWAKPFKEPPLTQFIIACYTKWQRQEEVILGRNVISAVKGPAQMQTNLSLYFCEPPNTMILHERMDESHGFIGIGTGSATTKPEFNRLFDSLASARTRLIEFYTGGTTVAVVVPEKHVEPIRINPLDMEAAKGLGRQFDFVLRMTMSGVIPQTDEAAAENFANHISKFYL